LTGGDLLEEVLLEQALQRSEDPVLGIPGALLFGLMNQCWAC